MKYVMIYIVYKSRKFKFSQNRNKIKMLSSSSFWQHMGWKADGRR